MTRTTREYDERALAGAGGGPTLDAEGDRALTPPERSSGTFTRCALKPGGAGQMSPAAPAADSTCPLVKRAPAASGAASNDRLLRRPPVPRVAAAAARETI